MDRGSYIAASGGLAQLRKLEIVNNNLANINTPGFKRELIVTDRQEFDQTLAKQFESTDPFARADHERTPGVVNIRAVTDFTQGPIKATGNPLDVALKKANQFFVVNTPEGPMYTRAGNFTINQAGDLVTQDGFQVSGDGGAITIDGPVDIAPNGAVRVNGTEVGKLRVVEFNDTSSLVRMGGSRFSQPQGSPAPQNVEGEVEAKSLEMANVSAISSVVELMTAHRAFEMYTKSAQSLDAMNQTAASQIGRSRG